MDRGIYPRFLKALEKAYWNDVNSQRPRIICATQLAKRERADDNNTESFTDPRASSETCGMTHIDGVVVLFVVFCKCGSFKV